METETGKVQKNRYDAEGLRYELIENGRRTRFVYHNGELLHEKEGKAETSYHLGAGIEAFQRDRKTYYYHQDEQLNTTLISDENASIKNHYQYDAFGAGLEAVEALPNRIRYTGQQYDEQTGQYYLRARYYNPILGRFIQEDVYQGDGLNLYAYCRNNPVVYYDPSGFDCGKSGNIDDGTPTMEELIQQVPDKYKQKYKCKDFANTLEKLMKKSGLKGKRLYVKSASNYILSDKHKNISTNGTHDAIKVNNTIYDNMNPDGIDYNIWEKDLGIADYRWMFHIDPKDIE